MKQTSTQPKTTLMTQDSIWKRITSFAVPLFLGNLFQQLYNTADSVIVGNFLGSNALAAESVVKAALLHKIKLSFSHRYVTILDMSMNNRRL